jgi:hypothetical protein
MWPRITRELLWPSDEVRHGDLIHPCGHRFSCSEQLHGSPLPRPACWTRGASGLTIAHSPPLCKPLDGRNLNRPIGVGRATRRRRQADDRCSQPPPVETTPRSSVRGYNGDSATKGFESNDEVRHGDLIHPCGHHFVYSKQNRVCPLPRPAGSVRASVHDRPPVRPRSPARPVGPASL